MKIVYLTRDLMFPSRAEHAARSGGNTLQVVGSPEHCAEAIDDQTRRVVVDLASTNASLSDLAAALIAQKPDLEMIAYGPHVQGDRLSAAQAAGFRTMTNGQLNAGMQAVFGE